MLRRLVSWWRSRGQPPSTTPPCEKCGHPASVFDYRRTTEGNESERQYCGPCSQRNLWIPTPFRGGAVVASAGGEPEIRVEVERLVVFTSGDEQLVILREVGGPRRLSFVTGYTEVTALNLTLRQAPSTRPQTHQAWLDTVTALGASVKSACVLSRRDVVYFAEIRLLRDGNVVRIDARPSDALLIALRAGVPFLFAEGLLAADAVSEPEPD